MEEQEIQSLQEGYEALADEHRQFAEEALPIFLEAIEATEED